MTQAQPEGFLAVPSTGTGPGVLVLHAWWGLNDAIKTLCTRFADAGFIAFAPDLYHGMVADTIEGAEAFVKTINANAAQTNTDLAEATQFLAQRAEQTGQGLAVVGFSLGASYALDLASADPEHFSAVVVFYGTGGDDFTTSKASYLGHFAENDDYEPQSSVDALEEALRDAGRPATFYRYPSTGHWFFEPDRIDAYNQAAAELAWERTLAFLKRNANV